MDFEGSTLRKKETMCEGNQMKAWLQESHCMQCYFFAFRSIVYRRKSIMQSYSVEKSSKIQLYARVRLFRRNMSEFIETNTAEGGRRNTN